MRVKKLDQFGDRLMQFLGFVMSEPKVFVRDHIGQDQTPTVHNVRLTHIIAKPYLNHLAYRRSLVSHQRKLRMSD